jgi:hypothetical protein
MDKEALIKRAKELKVQGAHLMKEETLVAKIAEEEAKIAPQEPEDAPEANVVDVDNPDAEALAKRQQEASMEARMKDLEDRVIQAEEKNMRLESEAETLRSTVHKKPVGKIPENPNPNRMLYRKDEKGEIIHEQFSPIKAEQLLKEGEWVDTPAKLKGD